MTEKNTAIWEALEYTDPMYISKIGFGRKSELNSVKTQIRIYKMTKHFGPMGGNWGVDGELLESLLEKGWIVHKMRLWFKDDSGKTHEVFQYGQASLTDKDDDAFKKSWTDGMTKCFSLIGESACAYMDQADDNKYEEEAPKIDKTGMNQFKKDQKEIFRLAKKLPLPQQATVNEMGDKKLTEAQWYDLLTMVKMMTSVFSELETLKGLSEFKYEEIKSYLNSGKMNDTATQWKAVLERVRDNLEIHKAQKDTSEPGNWNNYKGGA